MHQNTKKYITYYWMIMHRKYLMVLKYLNYHVKIQIPIYINLYNTSKYRDTEINTNTKLVDYLFCQALDFVLLLP